MVKKLLPILALSALLTGCATTITNLTPKQATHNQNGLYRVDAALASGQQSLRWDSIKPSVQVGMESYPMRPTQLMTNRWETLIPVPPHERVVYYRFKFDYMYNSFGSAPKPQSKLSPIYRLQIQDR